MPGNTWIKFLSSDILFGHYNYFGFQSSEAVQSNCTVSNKAKNKTMQLLFVHRRQQIQDFKDAFHAPHSHMLIFIGHMKFWFVTHPVWLAWPLTLLRKRIRNGLNLRNDNKWASREKGRKWRRMRARRGGRIQLCFFEAWLGPVDLTLLVAGLSHMHHYYMRSELFLLFWCCCVTALVNTALMF